MATTGFRRRLQPAMAPLTKVHGNWGTGADLEVGADTPPWGFSAYGELDCGGRLIGEDVVDTFSRQMRSKSTSRGAA